MCSWFVQIQKILIVPIAGQFGCSDIQKSIIHLKYTNTDQNRLMLKSAKQGCLIFNYEMHINKSNTILDIANTGQLTDRAEEVTVCPCLE